MLMNSQRDKEKGKAWRITIWSLLIGIVFLIILIFIGFPNDLWTPDGTVEFVRAFLTVALIACGSIALIRVFTALEDWEGGSYAGDDGPIFNSLSGWLSMLPFVGIIGCVVYVIRYIYLSLV
ncbi:MAG: hypothetical protein P9X24_08340 [Candidatus Hatepunaea meridiana]|nr:hypothetical protein [Candidatus Hatepunaea meridiana]